MTDTSLIVPGWEIDSTQNCDGKKSVLNVYVNGYKVKNPTNYTPQDGDSVQFVIEPDPGESGKS